MKITAENRDSGEIVVLARPISLKGAARLIHQNAEFWDQRWEGIQLEGTTHTEIRRAYMDGILVRTEMKDLSAMLVK